MEQNVVLANRLKELMEEKGMSLREVAEKSEIPVRRLHRMANAGVSNPSVFVMIRICDALGVTLDEFFKTEEFQKLAQ